MSLELTTLPTTALITSTIAVSLFILKEILEYIIKKKEKKKNIKAIDALIAIQGINIIKQLLFIVYLSNQVKVNSKYSFSTDYLGRVNFVKFDEFEQLAVPGNIEKFSHDTILDVTRMAINKFHILVNVNGANELLSNSIDAFLCHIKNEKVDMLSDELSHKEFTKKIVKDCREILQPIESVMKINVSYEKLINCLDDELKKL
ncbi:TPA: hypothetical protein ACNVDR_000019 [Morganella morganii]